MTQDALLVLLLTLIAAVPGLIAIWLWKRREETDKSQYDIQVKLRRQMQEQLDSQQQTRFRLSVWTGAEDAWLEDLFVEESARGKGYGRALVEAAVERARSRGCDRIQLDVNQANVNALKLYESCGFKPVHNPAKWGEAPDFFYTREIDR